MKQTKAEQAAAAHVARRLRAKGITMGREPGLWANPLYRVDFRTAARERIEGVHNGTFYCSQNDCWAIY